MQPTVSAPVALPPRTDHRRTPPTRQDATSRGRLGPVAVTVPPAGPAAAPEGHGPRLRLATVPPLFAPVRRWVLHSPSELHAMRTELREEADTPSSANPSGPPPRGVTSDKAVLVASELAANALLHGSAPTVVELCEHEGRLLVTAADHDLTGEPRLDGYSTPGCGGFGLKIARRLSVDMGWHRNDEVKVVWAEIGGPHTTA